MFSLPSVVGAILQLLFPGPAAFFYRAPIGFLIAFIVARQQGGDSLTSKDALFSAAVCGFGGAAMFALLGQWPSLLTAALAVAAMWVGVHAAAERYLHKGMETAYSITGVTCVTVWLVWMIVAALVIIVRASIR